MERLIKLGQVRPGQFPAFRISGRFFAKVVSVYDGDTITVLMALDEYAEFYEHKIRVYGYDSPELRPKRSKDYLKSRFDSREDEKSAAKAARDFLRERILDEIVEIRTVQNRDPFNRLLAEVYARDNDAEFNVNICDFMISNGHGLKYYGKTKQQ
jgi:endonuclease YncB( thermonuclease family)